MATDASLNIQVVEKLTKKAVLGLIAISFRKNQNENVILLKKHSIFLDLITLSC